MNVENDLLANVSYYHQYLKRPEAEKLLRGKEDGSFLLRKSKQNENYVISVVNQGAYLHYSVNLVERDGLMLYSVNNGTPFSSPREVVEHYIAMRGGLKCQLLNPVPKILPTNSYRSAYETEVEWFHNDITREEDSMRLSQGYRKYKCNGIFLVRKKDPTKHVLSLVNAGRVHRYIIHQDQNCMGYYIAGKQKRFNNLPDLVDYHQTNPYTTTGIQCQLTLPCPKTFGTLRKERVVPQATSKFRSSQAPTHQTMILNDRLQRFLPKQGMDVVFAPSENEVQSTMRKTKVNWKPTSIKPLLDKFTTLSLPEDSPGYTSPYQNFTGSSKRVARDLFIKEDKISVYQELGKGHFGAVCMARCSIAGKHIPCAVKYLKGEDIIANKTELLAEAAIMQELDHPHIVRLLAVCDTPINLMMLLELAPLGHLRDFLKNHNESTFSESKILNIMKQVCHGMEYLANNNIVHRDLAARNILLVSENFVKVSDFGMSKVLKESENYYRAAQPGSWPLRWYSPEALCYYKFTTKCDVWSYGITLWEAFSYGSRPYQGMKGREVLAMLDDNERLDCPFACPPEVYDLMLYCWTYDMDQRPTFSQVISILDQISIPENPPPLHSRSRSGEPDYLPLD